MAVSVSVWSDVLLLNVGQSVNTFQSPPSCWLWSKHSRRAAFRNRCRVVGAGSLGFSLRSRRRKTRLSLSGPAPFLEVEPIEMVEVQFCVFCTGSNQLHQIGSSQIRIKSNRIKSKEIQFNHSESKWNALRILRSLSCTTTVLVQTHPMLVFSLVPSDCNCRTVSSHWQDF